MISIITMSYRKCALHLICLLIFPCLVFAAIADDSYIDCYIDRQERTFSKKISGDKFTPKTCKEACANEQTDYDYVGLQYYGHCFCGTSDEFNGLETANPAECNTQCTVDNNFMCGGSWRNSVYSMAGYSPPVTANMKENDSLGCYIDTQERTFSKKISGDKFTPKTCKEACANEQTDYDYVGLQYYGHCFCGTSDEFNGLETANPAECNTQCTVDNNFTCGGSWRNSVYSMAGYSPPVTANMKENDSLGCYIDTQERTFSKKISGDKFTPKTCKEACANEQTDYDYVGLQYYGHCFCGTSDEFNGLETANPAECNTQCTVDNNFMCGGSWRNSVYKIITEALAVVAESNDLLQQLQPPKLISVTEAENKLTLNGTISGSPNDDYNIIFYVKPAGATNQEKRIISRLSLAILNGQTSQSFTHEIPDHIMSLPYSQDKTISISAVVYVGSTNIDEQIYSPESDSLYYKNNNELITVNTPSVLNITTNADGNLKLAISLPGIIDSKIYLLDIIAKNADDTNPNQVGLVYMQGREIINSTAEYVVGLNKLDALGYQTSTGETIKFTAILFQSEQGSYIRSQESDTVNYQFQ